ETVALHGSGHRGGQGSDHRRADAVQPAGMEVVLVLEFAAGMQSGENQLEGGSLVLGVHVDGDPTAVIADGDGLPVLMQGDRHLAAGALKVSLHGVRKPSPKQMLHTTAVAPANIHAGALTHRLEAFEDGDVLCGILWFHLTKRS